MPSGPTSVLSFHCVIIRHMFQHFSIKNTMVNVTIVLFVILTGWWLALSPFSHDESLIHAKFIWGSCYQVIAIWGGVCGLLISRSFGGFKSFLGKSIIFFSLGLLFQSLGQSFYSYYNLFANVQAPYPSLGDVGFFGSIIFYIFGVVYLAHVSGVRVSLGSFYNKLQAILIPLCMLILSYVIFLKDYVFEWSDKLKIFLDFGYPLGQVFYLSLAILTLILSRKVLGGIMKKPVIFFLISLIMQYISDFNFLYHANHGTWFVGGIGDFLYMFSYLLMTLSIIQIAYVLKSIKDAK